MRGSGQMKKNFEVFNDSEDKLTESGT